MNVGQGSGVAQLNCCLAFGCGLLLGGLASDVLVGVSGSRFLGWVREWAMDTDAQAVGGGDAPSVGRIVASGTGEGNEHRIGVRVYYEDTDFSGVVYHARYLHFLERGRTDYLRLMGFDQAALRERQDAVVFAVHAMDLRFHSGARMDDALVVRTVFTRVRGARIHVRQWVERDGAVCVWADVTIATLTREGRPRRLPEDMIASLGASLVDAGQLPLV